MGSWIGHLWIMLTSLPVQHRTTTSFGTRVVWGDHPLSKEVSSFRTGAETFWAAVIPLIQEKFHFFLSESNFLKNVECHSQFDQQWIDRINQLNQLSVMEQGTLSGGECISKATKHDPICSLYWSSNWFLWTLELSRGRMEVLSLLQNHTNSNIIRPPPPPPHLTAIPAFGTLAHLCQSVT